MTKPSHYDGDLWNEDLAPTNAETRTWCGKTMRHYGLRWWFVYLLILSAGLVSEGMNWYQAVITVLLGNIIVLVPMMLIGHAGAKYGLPFPVLLRAFGTKGAKIPALARGLVACGWFGINTGWAAVPFTLF